jgi:hypothetical protein
MPGGVPLFNLSLFIMPYRNGTPVQNATKWTKEMEQFLIDNYKNKTNPQLANELGLRLTVTRNKMRELGLKRIEMEYWTPQMIEFLKDNYTTKGDVEIAMIFQEIFPKKKKWTKKHISKKRKYLNLRRTPEQIHAIASANSSKGGRSFTIIKNSSSINLHPSWVAQMMAWRNKEQQSILLKNPTMIQLGKSIILLNRAVKNAK